MPVIHDILADYDEKMLECPVNHPRRHRLLEVPEICPRCKSGPSGQCGREASASYDLIAALREYAETTKD